MRCIAISICLRLSVCVSCLLAMSQRSRVQSSRNFLYMLPVVVARTSSDNSTIRYVLPVFWMTSCLPKIGRAETTPIVRILSDSPRAAPWAKSDVYHCLVISYSLQMPCVNSTTYRMNSIFMHNVFVVLELVCLNSATAFLLSRP